MILNKDISHEKLKTLTEDELKQLCAEIRSFLIKSVSRTGGHLASNLGTVELTVALHKVFNSGEDKFIFDVGHQCYTHKILTGRYERFSALRKEGGVGGFPRASESPHDAFIGGHSGISVSAALGIAEAMKKTGVPHKAIAIAGDGAFTDGAIYEGMNNAGKSDSNLLVILNDNGMSISKNTGAIAAYLSHLRSTRKYYRAKSGVKSFLGKNKAGEAVSEAVSATKKFVKNAIYQSNFFENLGFKYYGIVDGHNLGELTEVFELAKMIDSPCLIHVKTKKGKGFKPAERNSGEYHAAPPVSAVTERLPISGKPYKPDKSCSEIFGRAIAELGEKDNRIIVISAAMKYATGCNYFNDKFPERFYDCGIAEGHAVTFAAGLASGGLLPIFAVYSTFLQRSFDRLLHDCSIENTHVVIAIDRAGAVGEDGETHQGIFDVAMLSAIPNFTVFSPANADELRSCLEKALYETEGPVAVRYPRGSFPADKKTSSEVIAVDCDYSLIKSGNSDRLVVTYGRVAALLQTNEKDGGDLLRLVRIKPIPVQAVEIAMSYGEILFVEEGIERGGIGEALLSQLSQRGWKGSYRIKAFSDYIPAAEPEVQMRELLQ